MADSFSHIGWTENGGGRIEMQWYASRRNNIPGNWMEKGKTVKSVREFHNLPIYPSFSFKIHVIHLKKSKEAI